VILGIDPPEGAHYADRDKYLDPNTEHPPLGKLLMAGSMTLLGDNGIGWRVPSVIAGMVVLMALFATIRAAGGTAWLALLAVFLTSLDNLSMVHGRIGVLRQLRQQHGGAVPERAGLQLLPAEVRGREPVRQLRREHGGAGVERGRFQLLPSEVRVRVPLNARHSGWAAMKTARIVVRRRGRCRMSSDDTPPEPGD